MRCIELNKDPLQHIYTSSEAETKYNLKPGTIRASCSRGKLKKHIGNGVKKSGDTWIVTDDVMSLEYGKNIDREGK